MDLRSGPVDLPNDCRSGAIAGAEIHFDRRYVADVDFDGPGHRTPEERHEEQDQGAYGEDRDKTIENGTPDTMGLEHRQQIINLETAYGPRLPVRDFPPLGARSLVYSTAPVKRSEKPLFLTLMDESI